MAIELSGVYTCNAPACAVTEAATFQLDASLRVTATSVPTGWLEVVKSPVSVDEVISWPKTECYCPTHKAGYETVVGDTLREG